MREDHGAADHLVGKDIVLEHGADGPLAPRVIFTDPQVAAVGHTTRTAEQAGLDVRVVDVPTSGNAGGSYYGRGARGTSRFVVSVTVTYTGTTAVPALNVGP